MAWYDEVQHAKKRPNKLPNMTVLMLRPPSEGFQGYTGAGANGVVEPDKAAVYDQQGPMGKPAVYHEGELVEETPNGKRVMSEPQVNRLRGAYTVPETEEEQRKLARMERNRLVQGFKGGYMPGSERGQAALGRMRGVRGYQTGTGPPDWLEDTVTNPTTPTGTPATGTAETTPPPDSMLEHLNLDKADYLPGGKNYQPGTTVNQGVATPEVGPVTPGVTGLQPPETKTAVGEVTPPPAPTVAPTITPPPPVDTTPPPPEQVDAGMPTTETAQEVTPAADDRTQKGLNFFESLMEGESPLADRLRTEAMSGLGAAHAAEKAATQQSLIAGGMSPKKAAVMMAELERGQQSERGKVMSEIDKKEMEQAFQAANSLVSWDQASKRFDFDKEKYGDQEFQRMYDDVAVAGMSKAEFMKKYPNADPESYENMSNVFEVRQKSADLALYQAQTSTYGSEMASHFQAVGYQEGYNWQDDPQARDYLQKYWETFSGNEGTEFDPQWADQQFRAVTDSPMARTINEWKNDPNSGWDAMDEVEQTFYNDQVFPALTSLTTFGPVKFSEDADGALVMTDSEGNTLWGEKVGAVGGSDSTPAKIEDGTDVLSGYGIFPDPARLRQFIEDTGEAPKTAAEWEAWDEVTLNPVELKSVLNNELNYTLASELTKKTLASPEYALEHKADLNVDKSWDSGRFAPGGGQGVISNAGIKYDSGVYSGLASVKPGDSDKNIPSKLTMSPETKTYYESQAGKIMFIDGEPYRVDVSDPVIDDYQFDEYMNQSGDDIWTSPVTADALNLVSLEDGTRKPYVFGTEINVED